MSEWLTIAISLGSALISIGFNMKTLSDCRKELDTVWQWKGKHEEDGEHRREKTTERFGEIEGRLIAKDTMDREIIRRLEIIENFLQKKLGGI